jgi:hypothetical protein
VWIPAWEQVVAVGVDPAQPAGHRLELLVENHVIFGGPGLRSLAAGEGALIVLEE